MVLATMEFVDSNWSIQEFAISSHYFLKPSVLFRSGDLVVWAVEVGLEVALTMSKCEYRYKM